jgi:hypothetical protein
MPSFEYYKLLKRLDTTPLGDGGQALNENFTELADRIGPVNYSASTNPSSSNHAPDYYAGSIWINTSTNEVYFCVESDTGSATWVSITDTGGGGSTTIGTPTDGSWADGYFTSWTSSTSISNAFDDVSEKILSLDGLTPTELSVATSDTSDTVMTTDGNSPTSSNSIVLNASTTYLFDARICARSSGGEEKSFKIEGMIGRDGSNNTSLVNNPSYTYFNKELSSWGEVEARANDTLESLEIVVNGKAATNVSWQASIYLTSA